jgi:hypothetical protein
MEMTDNELLKLAAKAAGDVTHEEIWKGKYSHFERKGYGWNPLTYDGDALRLAVQLQMVVGIYPTKTNVTADGVFLEEFHGDNPSSTTRRVIVMAAAEIGKGIK